MKINKLLAIPVLIAAMAIPAFADHVTVDYNHSTKFTAIKTYSWSTVHTANSIWDTRVKEAIDKQLAAKGLVEVPAGGNVALVAVEKVSIHQQFDTAYNGFGGRRWGGMGESTMSVDNYKVGTLVVNVLDGHSMQLIWKGTSESDLTGNPEKNTKKLDSDVQKMFKKFPPNMAS
jgi:hypothetical protein